jgi:hypothetical protein
MNGTLLNRKMKFIQELIWLFTLIFDIIKNYQVLCIGA